MFSFVVQYLCFLLLAIFASYTKSLESKLGDHSPLVVNTVHISGRLCYGVVPAWSTVWCWN